MGRYLLKCVCLLNLANTQQPQWKISLLQEFDPGCFALYHFSHSTVKDLLEIMGLNVPGLIATVGFYVAVLGTGIWAAKRSKAKKSTGTVTEVALLGGRSINLAVGIFTMTGEYILIVPAAV